MLTLALPPRFVYDNGGPTLDNRTHWRTDQLRAFVERVAQTELPPEAIARLRVRIVYRRGRRPDDGAVTGYAPRPIGTPEQPSSAMTIRVGRHFIARHDLALTLAHEMAHCRGVEHPAMKGDPRYTFVFPATVVLYAWTSTLPLTCTPHDDPA